MGGHRRNKRKATNSGEFDCGGRTTKGNRYKCISEMWAAELSNSPEDWYTKSDAYWKGQEPSVDGMLGGMANLDPRDVAASRTFLTRIFAQFPKPDECIALDVGAGIGRVTKHLLSPLFPVVDMLEQNSDYLEKSKKFLESANAKSTVQHRVLCGMQDFTPGSAGEDVSLLGRYNLIWIQWCIIYLTDDDLVHFLQQCVRCLAPGGVICIKDNLARTGFLVDKEDSSISRSDKYLKALFKKANMQLVREERQMDFPKSIFPVKMYALRPNTDDTSGNSVHDPPEA